MNYYSEIKHNIFRREDNMKYIVITFISILTLILLFFIYSSLVLAKESDEWMKREKNIK